MLVGSEQADSMTKLHKKPICNLICKTNLLQEIEKINVLFASLGSVRVVKNCDLGLENAV